MEHFSYEEHGLLRLHWLLLVVFLGMFGLSIHTQIQHSKNSVQSTSPHFIIILSLFFHLGGIFMELLHLWMYSSNGRGIPVFDIFSLISYMVSEVAFSSMLMMIAYGWTLTF